MPQPTERPGTSAATSGDSAKDSLPWLWSSRSANGPDTWCLIFGMFLKPTADPERVQDRHGPAGGHSPGDRR